MAHRRKRVGEIDTNTVLLIGGGVLLLGVLYFMSQPSKPAVTVVKPAPSSSAALTAAEITAGAGVVNTLVNDLTSDDSDS